MLGRSNPQRSQPHRDRSATGQASPTLPVSPQFTNVKLIVRNKDILRPPRATEQRLEFDLSHTTGTATMTRMNRGTVPSTCTNPPAPRCLAYRADPYLVSILCRRCWYSNPNTPTS
ncbi:hypothetical protein B0T16DRAFT_406732 [Cercophora newfieldiana]|uniref:Uncharacterized protein n=1 Tax=Cercophora newfieldiana TaxID=92897 RepID=A0AA40CVB7_9PEZI|nr:hypothetical protein B0T16DRAFT_406732 [Cercophora newfieldiana]